MQRKQPNPILATLVRALAASEFAICVLVLVVGSAVLAPHRLRASAATRPAAAVAQPLGQRHANPAPMPARSESAAHG